MKLIIIITYSILALIVSEFIKAALIMFYVIKSETILGIAFILCTTILLGTLYKHRFWIASCIFLAIHELIKLSVRNSFRISDSIVLVEKDTGSMILLATAMIFLLFSLVFAIKFLSLRNFMDYFWFKKYMP